MAVEAGGAAPTQAPSTPLPRTVDPVGAGDAFAAGFLVARLEGMAIGDALALANRCGAFATTAPGDIEALPRREEVAPAAAASPDVRR
jgi:sugar/nucleoside kinase (ribokinase family)